MAGAFQRQRGCAGDGSLGAGIWRVWLSTAPTRQPSPARSPGGGRALAQLLGGSEGVQQHAVGALASLAANNDANQAAITVKAARVIPLLPAAAGQLPRGCPPGRR